MYIGMLCLCIHFLVWSYKITKIIYNTTTQPFSNNQDRISLHFSIDKQFKNSKFVQKLGVYKMMYVSSFHILPSHLPTPAPTGVQPGWSQLQSLRCKNYLNVHKHQYKMINSPSGIKLIDLIAKQFDGDTSRHSSAKVLQNCTQDTKLVSETQ